MSVKLSQAEKITFNNSDIHDLNLWYMHDGYYVECQDDQAFSIGRD